MKRINKSVIALVLLTCFGLILKKLMVPGASFLLFFSLPGLAIVSVILCVQSFSPGSKKNNSHYLFPLAYFVFALSAIAFLFCYQYWKLSELLVRVSGIGLITSAAWLVYYFIFQETSPEVEKRIYRELLLPFLFFLFVIPFSAIANQREFHNFFKGSTYESFVRKTYPEDKAQFLLDENQCDDLKCLQKADDYYRAGIRNDSLKNWDEAFACYNKAIDCNIRLADAYCRRASNRMLHTEVDSEITAAAIRDCNLAIALDAKLTPAYLRRAFTNLFIKRYDKACADFKKAKQLDSTLVIGRYIDASCGSSVKVQ